MDKEKPKEFKLNLNYFNKYKFINGRKYQYNGTVPTKMKDDIIRVYRRHNILLEVEPDKFNNKMIMLWSRRLWYEQN